MDRYEIAVGLPPNGNESSVLVKFDFDTDPESVAMPYRFWQSCDEMQKRQIQRAQSVSYRKHMTETWLKLTAYQLHACLRTWKELAARERIESD